MPSIKELKKYTNKEVEITRLAKFNDFFAVYIAKILLSLYPPITGNQVSFLMIFFAIILGVLFSFGEFWLSLIASVLLFFEWFLDGVDGTITRYKGAASIRGIFLDLLMHSVTEPMVFFGLTLGVFKNTNNFWLLAFGMLATIFSSLVAVVQKLKNNVVIIKLMQYAKGKKLDELKRKKLEFMDTEEGRSKRFIFWKRIVRQIFLYLTFRYFLFVLLFSIIFNFTQWVLFFYGIMLPIKWGVIVFYEFKMDYKSLEFLFKPYQNESMKR